MSRATFKTLNLDPGRTVLLVVDVENEFCHPDGKCFIGDRGFAAVSRLSQLQARCRERGVPIVFIRSVRETDDLEFTDFGRSPILLRDTWATEYVPEVAPQPGEPVIEKHSHDPFNGTDLVGRLQLLGVAPGARHTVLVTGVATHVCVACAVIGLSVRNYQPVLVADCAASSTAEHEELAFQLFSGAAYSHNVKLSTSDKITFAAGPPASTEGRRI
jgi:nicotinamidase-related amidase